MKKYSLYTIVFATFALLTAASVGSVYFFVNQHRKDLVNAAQEEKISLVKMIDDVLSSPRYLYEMAKAPGLERLLVVELASFKDVRFLRIITPEGVIYSSSLDDDWGKTINEPLIARALAGKTALIKDDFFNDEKIKVIAYPAAGGKILMIGFSLKSIEAAVKSMFMRDVITILGGLLVTYLFIFMMLRLSVIAPLKRMIFACEEIRQGNLDHAIETESRTEFGELATTFNGMTDNLKRSRRQLEIKVNEATEARKKIEEERNKTGAILVSLSDGLIVFNKNRRIILLNPEAEKILELTEKQARNKTLAQLQKFPPVAGLFKAIGNKIEPADKKFELVLKKDINYYFQISITPVLLGSEFAGLTLALRDITREKEIDRIKTEFVSIAAHQLRTPLSAIKWVLKIILDGDFGEINKEQRDLLAKGYKSNQRIIGLVNDLLNVSRMEEGKFGYNFIKTDFREILDAALENLKESISKNHLNLIVNKPAKPAALFIDKEKMVLALQNLLDNAIKYSPENGKIEISLEVQTDKLKTTIKDKGIGIPELEQKKLFSKFFRATNASRLQTEGTGLGLFLSKNIISRHGGEINIVSEEGHGTEVSFTLPLKPPVQ